jgi:hypothetical protein
MNSKQQTATAVVKIFFVIFQHTIYCFRGDHAILMVSDVRIIFAATPCFWMPRRVLPLQDE